MADGGCSDRRVRRRFADARIRRSASIRLPQTGHSVLAKGFLKSGRLWYA